MSYQDGFQRLRTPSPEETEPQLDLLRDNENLVANTDTLYSEFCYPGGGAGDIAFSTTLFTTLYEEEELRELHYLGKEFPKDPCEENGSSTRPTIYYVLRLFDSIRGFHQVGFILYISWQVPKF